MKRRTLLKMAILAVLGNTLLRITRAQTRVLSQPHRGMIAAIAEVVLPSSLGADGRNKAVAAFAEWLEGYKEGVPMSYGYGLLRFAVVPPSPMLRYPAQFARLQKLSNARGAIFTELSAPDRKDLVEAALAEAKITELPERPDGRHIASDLLSHFYNSSDGNDFLFKASIRVSQCRGLDNSADRPVSIS